MIYRAHKLASKFVARGNQAVAWSKTDDPEHPFCARVGDESWVVRVNDFQRNNRTRFWSTALKVKDSHHRTAA